MKLYCLAFIKSPNLSSKICSYNFFSWSKVDLSKVTLQKRTIIILTLKNKKMSGLDSLKSISLTFYTVANT